MTAALILLAAGVVPLLFIAWTLAERLRAEFERQREVWKYELNHVDNLRRMEKQQWADDMPYIYEQIVAETLEDA